MKKATLITLCAAIPVVSALLIWLMTGFVRWNFDLSSMDSRDRGGLIFAWVALIIIAEAVVAAIYCSTRENDDE